MSLLDEAYQSITNTYQVDVVEGGLTQYENYYKNRLAEFEKEIRAVDQLVKTE